MSKRAFGGRLSPSMVISIVALFVALGGSAYAAGKIGAKDIKANAITAGKIKKNAVTAAKIKANAVTAPKIQANAVTAEKIQDGAITGTKINLASVGTVPNSATTNVVKGSHGKLAVGQEATALEYGPFKITIKCAVYEVTRIAATPTISSSTDGSFFSSWSDGASNLGPATPETAREIGSPGWNDSTGPFEYDGPSDVNVSAIAASGQSFNAYVGLASEKASNSCWYSLNATITG